MAAAAMAPAASESRALYGGAITCSLPLRFLDISPFRQVRRASAAASPEARGIARRGAAFTGASGLLRRARGRADATRRRCQTTRKCSRTQILTKV
jgi:hypothetical protein